MKTVWRSLVPDKSRDSLKLIESFFYCARILMSMQWRSLGMRSLNHMLTLFVRFRVSDHNALNILFYLSDVKFFFDSRVETILVLCTLTMPALIYH